MCGSSPLLVACERGSLRAHRLLLPQTLLRDSGAEGRVVGCASSSSSSSTVAAVLIDISGRGAGVAVCPLPPIGGTKSGLLSLDGELAVRRIPVGATVRLLDYHRQSGALVAVCSRPRVAGAAVGTAKEEEEVYEVLLFCALTGRAVGRWVATAEATAGAVVLLSMRVWRVHERELIVLGAAESLARGEECPLRGGVLLLEVLRAAPSHLEVRPLFSQQERAPVSAIAPLPDGLLALCVGRRVTLYQWTGKALVGRAICDVGVWGLSLQALKNYLLVGDAIRGAALLLWDPAVRELVLLAKSPPSRRAAQELQQVFATEFLVHGRQLYCAVADHLRTLHLLRVEGSAGVVHLSSAAALHGGSQVSRLLHLRARTGVSSDSPTGLLVAATLDGGYQAVVPLESHRLSALCRRLVHCVPHAAGLHPLAYRGPAAAAAVDIDLAAHYWQLDEGRRRDLAHEIGACREELERELANTQVLLQL